MSYLSELLGAAYKEGMTEEEISKAVESIVSGIKTEKESINAEKLKLKSAFDKASAEAADFKKQLESHMTEDEKLKKTQEETLNKLIEENKDMKKKIAVAENVTQLVAIGYSEEMAKETAEAMYSGNMDIVFKNQKAVLEAREKAVREQVIKETPDPAAGGAGKPVTKEDFAKMSLAERMELYQKDEQLYNTLVG